MTEEIKARNEDLDHCLKKLRDLKDSLVATSQFIRENPELDEAPSLAASMVDETASSMDFYLDDITNYC